MSTAVLKKMLSEQEVAQEYNFASPATLRRWRVFRTGPPFVKVNGYTVRYSREKLEAWLAEQPTAAGR